MDQQQIFNLLREEYLAGNTTFMTVKEIDQKGKYKYGAITGTTLFPKLQKLYAFGYLELERLCLRNYRYRIKPKIAKNGLREVVNPISRNIKNMEHYRKLS